jgi:hypothetical protein
MFSWNLDSKSVEDDVTALSEHHDVSSDGRSGYRAGKIVARHSPKPIET